MSGIYGIPQQGLSRLCERAPVFNDVKVIDPVYLFRANAIACSVSTKATARTSAMSG
jgi:hypothetical protein